MLFQVKIKFSKEQFVKIMTRKKHRKNPGHAAYNVIVSEFLFIHAHNACNDGSKRSDNWHKPSEHNGLAAMLVIKFFRIVQISLLEQKIVFSMEQERTALLAEPLAHHVPGDTAQRNQHKQNQQVCNISARSARN